MKTSMISLALVCAGSLGLAACASSGGSSTTPAAKPATDATGKPLKVVVKVADAETEAKIPRGYTLIKRNGVEFYCHDEKVLGSHSQKNHVCETKQQMEAQRQSSTNTLDYANGR
ncbi:MAG TPA: hypothetical protein VN645_02530 [Steroidobacteraceae bacterium]|nr:hypothetical protein [Steroidobacteraceae bacterium]